MGLRQKTRQILQSLFPRTIRQFEQAYCSICDGRIRFWQRGIRIYSLGMTRAHEECAARYLRDKVSQEFEIQKVLNEALNQGYNIFTGEIDRRKKGHTIQ